MGIASSSGLLLGTLATLATFNACGDDAPLAVAGDDGGATLDGSPAPVPTGQGKDAAAEPDAFVPPGCAVTATPAEDACVTIEALGVFVSKKLGTPDGNGTIAQPFASLQKGIDEAKRLNKRVYACAETYTEAITFANGVSVYGYFDCSKPTWTVIRPAPTADGGAVDAGADAGGGATVHARIVSPTSPAAMATGITNNTVVESVDIVAPDGAAPSASSIGLIAQNSPKLVLSHTLVHAGKGVKGADGVNGVQPVGSPTKDGTAGHSPERCLLGACTITKFNDCVDNACVALHRVRPGGTNACTGGSGQAAGPGGNGGEGGEWTKRAATGFECRFEVVYDPSPFTPFPRVSTDGSPRPATPTTAQGGLLGSSGANGTETNGSPPITITLCKGVSTASDGEVGADGATGMNGVSASTGTLSAAGYAPGDGTAGTSGAPGQGGGGGGGTVPRTPNFYINGLAYWGASGSGGGAGGCGGLAGTPGHGGGASIALLLVDSPIAVRNSTIEASSAGSGGQGTLGSQTTPRGDAGPALGQSDFGLVGGAGGEGGSSGSSGSGAGGDSLGIAVHGAAPTLADTPTPMVGTAGAGVPYIAGGVEHGFVKAVLASGPGTAAPLRTF